MYRGEMMEIAKTAPDALILLWKGKIFLKPLAVRAIVKKLENRGYNFDDKALMMALRNAKFLTRKGRPGQYLYIQKYPFSEGNTNAKSRKNK